MFLKANNASSWGVIGDRVYIPRYFEYVPPVTSFKAKYILNRFSTSFENTCYDKIKNRVHVYKLKFLHKKRKHIFNTFIRLFVILTLFWNNNNIQLFYNIYAIDYIVTTHEIIIIVFFIVNQKRTHRKDAQQAALMLKAISSRQPGGGGVSFHENV